MSRDRGFDPQRRRDIMDGPPYEGPVGLEHRVDMLRAAIDTLRRLHDSLEIGREVPSRSELRASVGTALTFARGALPPPGGTGPEDYWLGPNGLTKIEKEEGNG